MRQSRLRRALPLFMVFVFPAAAFQAANEPARREVVVVTGTYDPIPLEEADRSIRVLDVRSGELVSATFADLLKLDASIDMRQRAANTVQADVSIRGAGFGQTLVLVDGIRLNDVQSGHHNFDVPFGLNALEQIEVLKGSGSTLYGSDAIGGVVNFITRRPETSELRLRGAVGNFGVNQQSGTLSYSGGRVAEQLTFSRDFSTGFIPNRDFRNLSLASTTRFRSSLGETSIVLANNDRPFGAEQFYGNFNSWERTRTWFTSARQALGKRTDASFAFRRHTDLFVLYRDRPEVFTNRHAVESFQAALRRREELGANLNLHYGVEGYRDSIDSNNLGRHDRARGAGYVALDLRALRRFSFSAGLRDEVFGSGTHEVSPTFAIGAWLAPAWKIRAAVSRAFRLPSYTDLYYHDPANLGSPDLRPERAWTYEGGLEWNAGGRWRASAVVFQRRDQDVIDYVRRSAAEIWRATNFQRLTFNGVELSAAARISSNQEIEFHYTGLHGAREALAGVQSKYVFNYPVNNAIASWRGQIGDKAIVRSRVGALQRLSRDTYAVWDVYAASMHPRVRPFVQFTNLTDARFEEIPGVPVQGRAIVAGIEIVAWTAR
jgi:iron complex outermembrane recepter protein